MFCNDKYVTITPSKHAKKQFIYKFVLTNCLLNSHGANQLGVSILLYWHCATRFTLCVAETKIGNTFYGCDGWEVEKKRQLCFIEKTTIPTKQNRMCAFSPL